MTRREMLAETYSRARDLLWGSAAAPKEYIGAPAFSSATDLNLVAI